MRTKNFLLLAVILAISFCSCQTSRPKGVEPQIVTTDREKIFAKQLSKNLDDSFGEWTDIKVEGILNSTMLKLISTDEKYKSALGIARIHLLKTAKPIVAAGLEKTVYISHGLLKSIEYENELAFVLATQLALLKDRVPANHLEKLHGEDVGERLIVLPTMPPVNQKDYLKSDWFEKGGLFDFGEETYLQAEREAIRLTYDARFDPRGAVMFVQRWKGLGNVKPLGKILPDTDERLKNARDEVAKTSPLRDPIVKSHAFDELRAHLAVKKAKTKK